MLKFAERVIGKTEESNHPFYYYLFIFVFAIMVRNFLEVFAYGEVQVNDWYAHLHYSSYYLALVGFVIWIFSLLLKENTLKIAKVVLTFMPVIITCPLIDLGVMYGLGIRQTLGYLSPELHGAFFSEYFTFFGHHLGDHLVAGAVKKPSMGPSIGYRLEVMFVLIGFGFYFFVKTRSGLKTLLGILASYTFIYFFCSTPYVLKFLFPAKYGPQLVPYYMFLFLIAGVGILFKAFPGKARLLVKDLRFLRLSFYQLIFLFGVVYGLKEGGAIKPSILFQGIFTMVSIAFAWKFSVMINNLEDVKIDAVSNPHRPLVGTLEIDKRWYRNFSWVVFSVAIGYALYANVVVFYFIAIYLLNYFIYSAPPIRLKRVPVISKLPIACNILLLFLLGAQYVGYSIDNFNWQIPVFILFGGTLALNIIDIKDYQGDKAEGVKTLPVIMGLKGAKFILAVVFLAGYALSFIFTDKPSTYLILLGLGVLQFILITRKNYRDRYVVGVFLVSILAVIIERFL